LFLGTVLSGCQWEKEGRYRPTWDDRLDELVELRREYKDEDNETDKAEVREALNEIRAELDEEYLKRLTHTYESEVASVEEWESVVNSIPKYASPHNRIYSNST